MNSPPKSSMTDAERLALASKLDRDLNAFIDSLPKRDQPDGPMDPDWLEGLDNHPFFMKKAPEPGDALHPLYEGLQQLKYDPNENTPQELASSYKQDGNFNFKHKNYRLAVIAYTEGLKALLQAENTDSRDGLEAAMYNNRSAAHWFLQNYRSSLRDAQWALKLQPNHNKALHRAANCCLLTRQFGTAIEYCDQLLDLGTSAEILDLRKRCTLARKDEERRARKGALDHKKQILEEGRLLSALRERGVAVNPEPREPFLALQPQIPALVQHAVHLTSDNELVWPVVFMYPEHKTMDFIVAFNENTTFDAHLGDIFSDPPAWDLRKEYRASNLQVYFEFAQKTRVGRVRGSQTLKEVLGDPRYVVDAGTPCFMVLVRGSRAEDDFLSSYLANKGV